MLQRRRRRVVVEPDSRKDIADLYSGESREEMQDPPEDIEKGEDESLAATSATTRAPQCQPNKRHGLGRARAYQRRDMKCWCICRLGDTDGGGLAMFRVDGSTMGMALRVRWASGW